MANATVRNAFSKVDRGGISLVLSGLLALVMATPLVAILVLAIAGQAGPWPLNLPRLIWTTVQLCVGAGLLALTIGTVLAWLVAFHSFPGRSLLRWMALLPLALPGYIISFVYVEAFTYAGPIQQALRDVFGWNNTGDYWFPEIRSLGGAIFVLGFALYPYVYLAGLGAFLRQPANQLHVARTLGRSGFRVFWDIALPQARPALYVGVLLVIMECINDIGAATFFGVGTLTTAVYSLWLDQGDLAAAAQIAGLLLTFMALLVYLETVAKARVVADGKNTGLMVRARLHGARGFAAMMVMLVPIFFGFLLPVFLLLQYSLRRLDEVMSEATLGAIGRSLLLAGLACILTLLIALVLGYVARNRPSSQIKGIIRLSTLGYALPGTVLGIGILVPFGQFDQWLNRLMLSWANWGPGLVLSGGIFALVFAYVTRFLIIAVDHVDEGFSKIPENIDHVARTLGHRRFAVFRDIQLPLLRSSLLAASLLTFVDAMKELPATLMLRPFDFDTLATRVFSLASLGQFESAAIPALLIVMAGLVPVAVLSRHLRQTRANPGHRHELAA
jgi:iron(III) transport system permease protein